MLHSEISRSQESTRYRRYRVAKDGDCGYTAFGITRVKAYNLISRNFSDGVVKTLLTPVVHEQLLLENFVGYLKDRRIIKTEITLDAIKKNMEQWLNDISIILAYLNYDIMEKKIDAGWAHPALLQALAYIQGIKLRIWQLGEDQQLIPHSRQEYAEYSRGEAQQELDLLFINRNHFERLELLGVVDGEITLPIFPEPRQPSRLSRQQFRATHSSFFPSLRPTTFSAAVHDTPRQDSRKRLTRRKRTLNYRNTGIRSAVWRDYFDDLQSVTSLEVLNFQGTPLIELTKRGARILASHLSPELQELNLRGTGVCFSVLMVLLKRVLRKVQLQVLDLSYINLTGLTEDAATELARRLGSLRRLNLHMTHISPAALCALFPSPKTTPSLKDLDLSYVDLSHLKETQVEKLMPYLNFMKRFNLDITRISPLILRRFLSYLPLDGSLKLYLDRGHVAICIRKDPGIKQLLYRFPGLSWDDESRYLNMLCDETEAILEKLNKQADDYSGYSKFQLEIEKIEEEAGFSKYLPQSYACVDRLRLTLARWYLVCLKQSLGETANHMKKLESYFDAIFRLGPSFPYYQQFAREYSQLVMSWSLLQPREIEEEGEDAEEVPSPNPIDEPPLKKNDPINLHKQGAIFAFLASMPSPLFEDHLLKWRVAEVDERMWSEQSSSDQISDLRHVLLSRHSVHKEAHAQHIEEIILEVIKRYSEEDIYTKGWIILPWLQRKMSQVIDPLPRPIKRFAWFRLLIDPQQLIGQEGLSSNLLGLCRIIAQFLDEERAEQTEISLFQIVTAVRVLEGLISSRLEVEDVEDEFDPLCAVSDDFQAHWAKLQPGLRCLVM